MDLVEKYKEYKSLKNIYYLFDMSGSNNTDSFKKTYTELYNKYHGFSKEEFFISFTTTAIEHNNLEDLLKYPSSGGSYISSGLNLVLNLLKSNENNLVILFSDGDNWSEDNIRAINSMKEVMKISEFKFYNVKNYGDMHYPYFVSTLKKEFPNVDLEEIKIGGKVWT